MYYIKRVFIAALTALTLMGCQDKQTETYLMEHPLYLKQEGERCQALNGMTQSEQARCDIIMQAAVKVQAIIDAAEADPEKFGQSVIDTEIACANAQNARQKTEQCNQVKAMLAVLGLGSPE